MTCPLNHGPNLPQQAKIIAALQLSLTEKSFPHISISDPNNPQNSATTFHLWLGRFIPDNLSSFPISLRIENCGCMLVELDDGDKTARDIVEGFQLDIRRNLETVILGEDALEFLREKMKEAEKGSSPRPARPGRDRSRLPPRRR